MNRPVICVIQKNKTMKNHFIALLTASCSLLIISCGSTSTPAASSSKEAPAAKIKEQQRPSLVNRQWMITEVMGEDVSKKRFRTAPFLQFTGESAGFRLSGSDGCNNLMGGYGVGDQGNLNISKVAFTRRACPEQGDINAALTRALSVANHFTLSKDGQRLTLDKGAGNPVIHMKLSE